MCRVCSVLAAVVLSYALVGCEVDGGNNLPRVPEVGLFIYAEANRHESEDEAQIAVAVFDDGEPFAFVGGDVFEARTATQRILLKDAGKYTGSYAALLPVDDSVQEVYFNVVHEPIEAREDRWYPIDLANIDPGPGELVGKSAVVNFPPEVTITGPAATVYTSINDVINLTWVAHGAGDTMRLLSAISCDDGLAETTTYGTVHELVDDDGLEALTVDTFIYDADSDNPSVNFIADAARVLLQELLNELSAGNIDPDFVDRKAGANPISSDCEIRLFLQRQRKGQFDETFDEGTVLGSRSAEMTINYVSAVPLN